MVTVTPTTDQGVSPQDLLKAAVRHLELYRQLTGQGKFVEAGEQMEKLSQILERLVKEVK